MKDLLDGAVRPIRTLKDRRMLPDLARDEGFLHLYEECRAFSMASSERMFALHKAVEYVVRSEVVGDIVECGVWKGGSSMMAALSLARLEDKSRTLYLYDTFAGMTKPSDKDVSFSGKSAKSRWRRSQGARHNKWAYSGLDEVRRNMAGTGYPQDRLRFVKGPVEETIPSTAPERISILRLDTDWYESTYHELEHLYPRLSQRGVLIIDDYGHWKGAREATDRYFSENQEWLLLNRIDYTGRIAVKVG